MKVRFDRSSSLRAVRLEDFAKQHNLELVIDDRGGNGPHRYAALFYGVEVRIGQSCLLGAYGTGHVPLIAVRNYCEQIAGKTIVVNYSDSTRNQPGIYVPTKLIPPKAIEEV